MGWNTSPREAGRFADWQHSLLVIDTDEDDDDRDDDDDDENDDDADDDDDDDDDDMDGQGAKRENSRNPLIIGNANLPLGSCIFDNHEL